MEHHARVDLRYIARFGDLTKREIQIFVYLLGRRRFQTGQCNPSRRDIAEGTGISDRGNLHRAIEGLKAKFWIAEPTADNFEICDPEWPGRIVVKSTTIKRPGPKPKAAEVVVKSTTIEPDPPAELLSNRHEVVVDSTTNRCQNDNAHIKDLNNGSNNVSNNARAAFLKKQPKPIAIPESFSLTAEMQEWFDAEVPRLRITARAATENFIEYWTNATKRRTAIDWFLRWQKGMRLLLEWQDRDDAERRGNNPGKHPEPVERFPGPEVGCLKCFDRRKIVVDRKPIRPPAEWKKFMQLIGAELTPHVLQAWFDKMEFAGVAVDDRPIVIANEITADWVSKYYAEPIERCLIAAGFAAVDFEFRIGEPGKDSIDCPDCKNAGKRKNAA